MNLVSSCRKTGARSFKWNLPEIPKQRQERIPGRSRLPLGIVVVLGQGISAAWNSIMSFIAPAGFRFPVRDPKKPSMIPIHRIIRRCVTHECSRVDVLAVHRRSFHERVSPFTRSPRSLSPRISPIFPPFRFCSPILRHFECLCSLRRSRLLPLTRSFDSRRGDPCTRRCVVATSKNPMYRLSLL